MATATATHGTARPPRARSASNAPLLAPPPPAANYGSTITLTPTTAGESADEGDERRSPGVPLLNWIYDGNQSLIGVVRDSYISYAFILLAWLISCLGREFHKELPPNELFKRFVKTLAFWFAEPLSSTPCTDCGAIQAGLFRPLYIPFMWLVGVMVVLACVACGLLLLFQCAVIALGTLAALIVPAMLLWYYIEPASHGAKSILLSPSTSSRAASATLLATPLVPLLTHTLLVLLDFRLSTLSWTLVYVDSTVYYLVRWAEWQKRWVRLADEEEELDKDAEEDAGKP